MEGSWFSGSVFTRPSDFTEAVPVIGTWLNNFSPVIITEIAGSTLTWTSIGTRRVVVVIFRLTRVTNIAPCSWLSNASRCFWSCHQSNSTSARREGAPTRIRHIHFPPRMPNMIVAKSLAHLRYLFLVESREARSLQVSTWRMGSYGGWNGAATISHVLGSEGVGPSPLRPELAAPCFSG
ncbi:hypothetical protein CPB85DRAFT_1314078 [Mucidula mucida]|nr:hypothetical protein CPB85DRAFT_1314078 [Mucidula mucida]